MPILVYPLIGLAGAWIGSLTTTAVMPAHQSSDKEFDYMKVAIYLAVGMGLYYGYRKVSKA